ncbi:MAG: GHMP kinase [Acidobacteria bacterium]|nr:GHMP kinase [Acidobacteriota bacterium]
MRHITATAPTRICDCGGWTDTWFARHGGVFHIAITPGAQVDVQTSARQAGDVPVTIHAENFGDTYDFVPGSRPWGRHPLIEAAIESIGVPEGMRLDVRVRSGMPPGAAVGTSASVCVALVGALMRLAGDAVDRLAVATAAQQVETERLGQQSGIQDQLAAAYGGVNYIEIDAYPRIRVHPIVLPPGIRDRLQARLMLILLAQRHQSTAMHERVIRDVVDTPLAQTALQDLRRAAIMAREAVRSGDLSALGRAMRDNTDAQRRLHPALVSAEAKRLIDLARRHHASGWHVNGAGGEGGSLTILCGLGPADRAALESAISAAVPDCRVVPVRIAAEGLRVTEHET